MNFSALERLDGRVMRRDEYRHLLSSARQKVNAHPPQMMTITEMVMWSGSRKPGRPLYLWRNKAAGERWRYLMYRHLMLMRRALHDVEWGWKPETQETSQQLPLL